MDTQRRLAEATKGYVAVEASAPGCPLLLSADEAVCVAEFGEEEANSTSCQSPAERFDLPAVPARKKMGGGVKKETGNLSSRQEVLSPDSGL